MIPKAFRIRDFKSIVDSGICPLSGDSITVLAGQNEAGKTAILTALRDFDLPKGSAPRTPEFIPEGRYDAAPCVSVEFEIDLKDIVVNLTNDGLMVPSSALEHLRKHSRLWIEKDLLEGLFKLDPRVKVFWEQEGAMSNRSVIDMINPEPPSQMRLLEPDEFAAWLRDYWPTFIYFDSFGDTLPREVEIDDVLPQKKDKTVEQPPASEINTEKYAEALKALRTLSLPAGTQTHAPNPIPPSTETPRSSGVPARLRKKTRKGAPQPVLDFLTLSGVDLDRLVSLSGQDKALGNYLQTCAAKITGDFLTYWKQKTGDEETVVLNVRHLRDEEGTLKLAFFVRDRVDQYPEQRSKGFLWFLSFYLRLAAAEQRGQTTTRVLLIDEPGSYLHARAQRDVLHLFEDRIAKKQHIIYSTHSPFLLPPDKIHRIRVVLKSSRKGTILLDRLTHPELRGEEFTDTLSPIITAIGLDIREALTFAKQHNLLVEGMSDLMYLSAWAKVYLPELVTTVNIFPGTGASSIPAHASLFLGWGLPFAVLLDRDGHGNSAKEKLERELAVPKETIVQPQNALTIEDIFTPEDFQMILRELDRSLLMKEGEQPSAAVRRLKVDKILLARTFAEQVSKEELTLRSGSEKRIKELLEQINHAIQYAVEWKPL